MLYPSPKNLVVERAGLHDVEIPDRTGVVSDRWQGIQHGELADVIVAAAKKAKLSVVSESWQLNPLKTDLFGSLDFKLGKKTEFAVPHGMSLSLGVRHSNIGRYALTFAVGAHVAVCSNGLMTGDFLVSKKHTTHLNLKEEVESAFGIYLQKSSEVVDLVAELQSREISDDHAAFVILEAAQQKLMAFRYVEDVYQLWREPPHEEFAGRDAWSLHNAFTETAKDFSPFNQYQLLKALPEMILHN